MLFICKFCFIICLLFYFDAAKVNAFFKPPNFFLTFFIFILLLRNCFAFINILIYLRGLILDAMRGSDFGEGDCCCFFGGRACEILDCR